MARMVLVHGPFGGSWCWEPTLPGLSGAGHSVSGFDLPGSNDDPTRVAEVSLDAYAERICEALADGPPAILIGHGRT